MSAIQDPARLIRDAETTEREVGATLLWVTSIGMVASLFAAGVYGWKLSGGDILTSIKAVLGAITIDLLLFRWLRVAKRLRKIGAQTSAGKVLDAVGVIMTYYLNGLGGFAVLITPKSMLAYGLMGVTYLFIPTVMLLSYIAMPDAQQVLQETRDAALDEQDRKRRKDADVQAAQYRAEQDRKDELQKSSDRVRVAEAADRTKRAELANEQSQREAKARAADRMARAQESTNILAAALLVSTSVRVGRHEIAVARMASALMMSVTAKGFPKRRTSRPRQTGSPASPGRGANGSPARRQGAAPVPRRPSTAASQQAGGDKPDVVRLAKQAAVVLENNPGIGRGQLATELGVSPHYARLALDQLKAEKDAARDAEIEGLLNGAPAPRDPDVERG